MSTNFKRTTRLEEREAELKRKAAKPAFYWVVRARVARLGGLARAKALTKRERVDSAVKASKAAALKALERSKRT